LCLAIVPSLNAIYEVAEGAKTTGWHEDRFIVFEGFLVKLLMLLFIEVQIFKDRLRCLYEGWEAKRRQKEIGGDIDGGFSILGIGAVGYLRMILKACQGADDRKASPVFRSVDSGA